MAEPKVESKLKGRKLEQKDINAIERRLSLSGGTLFMEMCGDLAMRNGSWIAEEKKLQDERVRLQAPLNRNESNGKISPQDAERVKAIYKELREDIPALRKKEAAEYMKPIAEYLESAYGEPQKVNNILSGYGERVYIDERRHYKKYW